MTSETLPDGTYILDEPVQLPDVLDMLIVGGGPAGTAAAFRAKELGITALVIDYDDLMKRIRDYAKDKLILPDFGGGDKMRFPLGGDLVQRLHFQPIDKDDMCQVWKGFYRECCVPAQIGVELTGLERQDDGTWMARCWNHRARQEQIIHARHVVIAMGRGVPRRFDIPGNTDGIAYHLDDATKYIGAPVCVIGGGTSAAEAVIAISNAKVSASDDSPVYWSYRGDRMPKVSKALSEVFFDAFIGNGNIRYRPSSEPVAVVTGPDRNEYLSIRVDRKEVAGRPCETWHLEFTKTACLACIGEDLPVKFLNSVGIYMMTGGPNMKERMVVTPLLETQQPDIYIIGDLLSQAYLETDNFNADPATFREIKHRGNVKASLRDGVFVAEVIKQKLEGRQEIHVALDFAGDEDDILSPSAPPPPKPEEEKEETLLKTIISSSSGIRQDGPPPESIPEQRRVEEETAFLIRMTPGGVDEDEYPLAAHGITTIGRSTDSMIFFPEDSLLSDNHASISHGPDGYYLRDDGSDSGTFFKLPQGKTVRIGDGDLVRIGRQILLFHAQNGGYFFIHYNHTGTPVAQHTVPEGTIVLGRQAPDITLDPDDKIMSRRHLAVSFKNGEISVKDLASLNGSYLRVKDARRLDHDDIFRVGQQIFRLSVREEVTPDDATIFRVISPFAEPPFVEPPVAEPPVAEPVMDDRTIVIPFSRIPPPPAASPADAPFTPPPVGIPFTPSPAPVPVPPPPPVPAPSVPSDEPTVIFQDANRTFNVAPGQSICDAAEKNGFDLNAECHAGICGSDPIRIISGAEHLNPVSDDEADALEDICGLEPGPCRLACMVRPTGPVTVERVKQ